MILVLESINACEYDIQSFEAEAIYEDIVAYYISLSKISITLGSAHLPIYHGTVHALNNSCLPRVFALLSNKEETTCRRLFSAIFNLCPNSRPVQCIMDFEIVVHTAFITVFHCAVVSVFCLVLGNPVAGRYVKLVRKSSTTMTLLLLLK